MLNGPFSSWPSFTQEEADAVQQVLLSNRVNYWTGEECRLFEQEFASWAGAQYALALANGTVALELALKALNIGPKDEVVVTPRTFIASASAIVAVGARPVFADVDPDSQNITAASVERVLTPRTRAVICVHLAGWPCDMESIMALSEQHGLYVIEDCAQAHGATYKGRSVGTIGHVAAWSFCQDKIMTTGGEGGMLTTNDEMLWKRAWAYKDHGKSYDSVYHREHPPGFRWLHESFGTNWRMTEMQAAIGRIQLKRMGEWHESRKRNAQMILDAAHTCEALRVPTVPGDIEHAWYKCYMFVRPDRLRTGWNRDRIIEAINERSVPCFSGSCSEVYLEKAFDDTSWRPESRLPVARELGETSLMFLVHPTLTEQEIKKTCAVLVEVIRKASTEF
ncbi:MAG: DegT/DnrJ/EryC1/StrS aminotransferase family protein [Pseudomonadota bacterium]|nr:DegT/DnrJ/EryC1/StrS aminotransferase family protein [Pseudomonadota bacterium]